MLLPTGKIGLMAPGTEFLLTLCECFPPFPYQTKLFLLGSPRRADLRHLPLKLKHGIPKEHRMPSATDCTSSIARSEAFSPGSEGHSSRRESAQNPVIVIPPVSHCDRINSVKVASSLCKHTTYPLTLAVRHKGRRPGVRWLSAKVRELFDAHLGNHKQ